MATVLVVDDEPDIVLFAQVNLELHGHVVRTAADGQAALVAVDEERPDAIVLDVMMPHLDGWSVLERLKAHGSRDETEQRLLALLNGWRGRTGRCRRP